MRQVRRRFPSTLHRRVHIWRCFHLLEPFEQNERVWPSLHWAIHFHGLPFEWLQQQRLQRVQVNWQCRNQQILKECNRKSATKNLGWESKNDTQERSKIGVSDARLNSHTRNARIQTDHVSESERGKKCVGAVRDRAETVSTCDHSQFPCTSNNFLHFLDSPWILNVLCAEVEVTTPVVQSIRVKDVNIASTEHIICINAPTLIFTL